MSADLDDLKARAMELLQQGALLPAVKAYAEALDLDSRDPEALHWLGVAAHQLGDSERAVASIGESLEIDPDQSNAHNNLGNVHSECGRFDAAAACYRRALELRPDYLLALQNLGKALCVLEEYEEAEPWLRRALALEPGDASIQVALGSACLAQGRSDAAVTAYRAAIDANPQHAAAYLKLGSLLRKLDRLDEAAAVYDGWLAFEPENALARHYRAACAGEAPPARASDSYVRAEFDGFAESFDESLERLDYRAPRLLGEALRARVGPDARLDILDLGCGTGLCAEQLRGQAARLDGVDLSPGMLERARERGSYDRLFEAELIAHLESCGGAYDALVSADTLVYIGDLAPVFTGARAVLRPGGWLLFTVERLEAGEGEGYRLGKSGRYAHAEDYLAGRLAAAGLALNEVTPSVLRTEGGLSVQGLLVAARRPA
jgi:predicted TPR repeat methyltransferase